MATQRDIRNRIQAISNTKKITKTMEMVSTAKMKKAQDRYEMTKPYDSKIGEIISNLLSSGASVEENPFFKQLKKPTRALILQFTSNRGLCGSFNTNIINQTLSLKKKLNSEGVEVLLYVVGKKGIGYLSFIKEKIFKSALNKETKFTFSDASDLGVELTSMFLEAEVDEVYISYSKVNSSVNQRPDIIKIFPITSDIDKNNMNSPRNTGISSSYIYDPNPWKIFSYIIPLYVKVRILSCFLQTSFSEQFARRVAMKNASDASTDMIRELTISYNRARQARITKEISEIIGGAAGLD